MQPDPKILESLLSQNDTALWSTFRALAKQKGFSLNDTPPPPSEMKRLRDFLSGAGQIDPREAKKMIDRMKQNGRG